MQSFLSYIYPHRFWIGCTVLLTIAYTIASLAIPTMAGAIINEGVLPGDLDYIQEMSVLMVGIAFLGTFLNVLAVYGNAHISASIGRDIRTTMVKALHDLTPTDINRFGTGSLLIRSTRDIEKVQTVIEESLNMIVPTPFMLLIGLGLSFSMNLYLGCLILGCMILMMIGVYYIEKRALPLVAKVQTHVDAMTNLLRDHIIGMSVIRAFNRRYYEHEREVTEMTHMASTSQQLAQLFALGFPLILLIFNLCTLCIVWIGGYQIRLGNLELGSIMAVIEYATLSLLSLLMAIFVFINIPESILSYQRIQEVFNCYDMTMKEKDSYSVSTSDQVSIAPDALFTLDHVSYAYPGAESPALYPINATIYAGESIAIMGGIGSGKSTLLQLLVGLIPPTSGSIYWKDTAMTPNSTTLMRQSMSYVPQKAYVFQDSIRHNIAYGVTGIQDHEPSSAEIEEAASIAQATEFIQHLEKGLDFSLSQGGTNVSGGQRQRLAMARALVRQADVYMFDDSFSALDATTEAKAREALATFRHRLHPPTLISVEQKVSSARQMDRIFVLSDGQLVGVGTHEELIKSCQVYQEIAASQGVTR